MKLVTNPPRFQPPLLHRKALICGVSTMEKTCPFNYRDFFILGKGTQSQLLTALYLITAS